MYLDQSDDLDEASLGLGENELLALTHYFFSQPRLMLRLPGEYSQTSGYVQMKSMGFYELSQKEKL